MSYHLSNIMILVIHDMYIIMQDQINCFYHGKVLEYPEWKVAMDSCQGLRLVDLLTLILRLV